jgi:Protein of unknown function (DUF2877)
MSFAASVAGRFARDALALGEGEVCAAFQRSCYLRFPGERYACVGDASLGRGPLNALVAGFAPPAVGERVFVSVSHVWVPAHLPVRFAVRFSSLEELAVPEEGLGCLLLGKRNALAEHAASALEALDEWLRHGLAVPGEADALIGLGPGLTPSGDDYLGGMMVALHALARDQRAQALWRWLQPRLAARTGPISAAHLAAAAEGEAHEALHRVLQDPSPVAFAALSAVGHCSGWDALAGAAAVLRAS